MIQGRFGDATGRPYVDGRLLLPRPKVSQNVSFPVDTGADRTTLMPADARMLGVSYSNLKDPISVGGVGGESRCCQENALVTFYEGNRDLLRFYSIDLIVSEQAASLLHLPSNLGRDILDRWHMRYGPDQGSAILHRKKR